MCSAPGRLKHSSTGQGPRQRSGPRKGFVSPGSIGWYPRFLLYIRRKKPSPDSRASSFPSFAYVKRLLCTCLDFGWAERRFQELASNRRCRAGTQALTRNRVAGRFPLAHRVAPMKDPASKPLGRRWLLRQANNWCREPRCAKWWTRTTKPLDSNSLIGTNNRFGSFLEEFIDSISCFETCKSRSQPIGREVPLLLHLCLTQPCSFRESRPCRQQRAANAAPMKAKVNRAVSQQRAQHTSHVRDDLLAAAGLIEMLNRTCRSVHNQFH